MSAPWEPNACLTNARWPASWRSRGGSVARCSGVSPSSPFFDTVRVISFGALSAITGTCFSRQSRRRGAYISQPKPQRVFHSVRSSIAASSISPFTYASSAGWNGRKNISRPRATGPFARATTAPSTFAWNAWWSAWSWISPT